MWVQDHFIRLSRSVITFQIASCKFTQKIAENIIGHKKWLFFEFNGTMKAFSNNPKENITIFCVPSGHYPKVQSILQERSATALRVNHCSQSREEVSPPSSQPPRPSSGSPDIFHLIIYDIQVDFFTCPPALCSVRERKKCQRAS